MIELKPSMVALTRAVNLSPVNPPRKTGKFATDFYGKFDGEPFKAAKNVKFKRETAIKTLASPQIKFDPNANLNRGKKFNQSSRPHGKPNTRKFDSLGALQNRRQI